VIPIPVEIDAMLAVLNLPKEMGDNGIFKEHKAIVMETIRPLVLDNHYQDAIRNDYPDDDPFLIAFRFGFCFLMLHSTCEFLNLKTLHIAIWLILGIILVQSTQSCAVEIERKFVTTVNPSLEALQLLLSFLTLHQLVLLQ